MILAHTISSKQDLDHNFKQARQKSKQINNNACFSRQAREAVFIINSQHFDQDL